MTVTGEKEGNPVQKCGSIYFPTAQKQLILEAFGEDIFPKLYCDNSHSSSLFTAEEMLFMIVCQELECNDGKDKKVSSVLEELLAGTH